MPYSRLGTNDPHLDASRVRSLVNAFGIAAGGEASGFPNGLGNKIILYHSSGSDLELFEATQAGLVAALAAAVSGDTVWLPSIPIALTAALVIPAGVAMVGISDDAILLFSGFSGAAIILGAGAQMFGEQVLFSVTGEVGVGIDNQSADTRIEHVHVKVSGATLANIKFGRSNILSAKEIWAGVLDVGVAHSIVWSNTFDFSDTVNDTTWSTITSWPAGYENPTVPGYMAFVPDGSGFYIANQTGIWYCTNQAAIRAAPSTTPTWTQILSTSTIIDGAYHVTSITSMSWWHDRLVVFCRTDRSANYYGEWFSGAWTWTFQGIDVTGIIPATYRVVSIRAGVAQDYERFYNPTTLVDYYQLYCGFGGGSSQALWRNSDPANTSWRSVWRANSATTKIIDEAGNVLHDTGLSVKNASVITGALTGTAVFLTMEDGELFVSEDGATFAQRATGYGVIQDTIQQGGGALAAARGGATSGALFNVSLDRGVIFANKTGNLSSVLSADLMLTTMGLVYG